MNKSQIGANAGLVWTALENARERKSIPELMRITGLDKESVLCAIGWLARENKISFASCNDEDYISLYQCFYY